LTNPSPEAADPIKDLPDFSTVNFKLPDHAQLGYEIFYRFLILIT